MKPLNIPEKITLGFLLESHYLADDFPNVVTTKKFSEFCTQNIATLEPFEKLIERTTIYGTFSAPRAPTTRRVFALPHPVSQLALSRLLAQERAKVRQAIKGSELTLYNTKLAPNIRRAFVGLDFEARSKREAEILSRHAFVLIADIGNFFHTVYTHSLPWAVLGKEEVKAIREGKDKNTKKALADHWSSKLDVAIQRGNSRETFGIPVGPDTSRIVAEILLAGIHKSKRFKTQIPKAKGYRLVDDFYVGFESEEAARRCLDELRKTLWDFNLHLNDAKTRIIPSSVAFDGGWKYEIDNFEISRKSIESQRGSIQRLMEIALHHCLGRQDAQPAAFFCSRILAARIFPGNLEFVLNCLLRVSRDFTACMKFVGQFISDNKAAITLVGLDTLIRDWVHQIFSMNAPRGHDYEVSWALIICGLLRFKVDAKFMSIDQDNISPVVLAVLGLLHDASLSEESWDDWSSSADKTALGRFWLPNYEAVLRGWTTDPNLVATIREDPLFDQMLQARVTFLDEAKFIEASMQSAKRKTKSKPRKVALIRRAGRKSPGQEYK